MIKQNFSKLLTDLIKIYLVYLLTELVWPDAEMRALKQVTVKILFSKSFNRFINSDC